jgi:hypothetical protein
MKIETFLILVMIFLTASCSYYREPTQAQVIEVFDQTNKHAHEVKLNMAFATNGISTEDMRGMELALSRTPNVNYEILSITGFPPPPHPFPVAAIVKVEHFYLYMCKAKDDKWHVFRIVTYVNGVVRTF